MSTLADGKVGKYANDSLLENYFRDARPEGPSIKYVTLGGVGVCQAQRYEALHGGGAYLADRYVTLIFNFICLVFSLSIEHLVQLR